MNELKRSLINIRLFLTTAFIIFVILGVCYLDNGWATYLNWNNASDMTDLQRNSPDGLFIRNFNGNVFRLWYNSLYTFRVMLPVLVTIPYLHTFIIERKNQYRLYVIVRKSHLKYILDKMFSIIMSTAIPIIVGVGVSFFIIYLFSDHQTSLELIRDIVKNNLENLFTEQPYQFWLWQLGLIVLYSVSFVIFSIGIASFLQHDIYIYALPFMIQTVVSIIMPSTFKFAHSFDMTFMTFNWLNTVMMISILFILGIVMLIINEKRWKKGEGI